MIIKLFRTVKRMDDAKGKICKNIGAQDFLNSSRRGRHLIYDYPKTSKERRKELIKEYKALKKHIKTSCC